MFQYAAGKRLSLARGVELKLDIRRLRGNSYRKYHLDVFHVSEKFATEEEIRKLIRGKISTWLLLPFRQKLGVSFMPPVFYPERQYTFDPLVLELEDNVFLKGRFHSEKYFADVADIIVEKYKLKSVSARAGFLHAEIVGCDSVSVHVRRGDYVAKPQNLARYGTCGKEYYEECIRRALEVSDKSRFFVFSDEPDWVRANMSFPENTFFTTREGLSCDAEELFLMSSCRQHITANSTFSWWGAWLDRSPQKIVYTPKRWFLAEDLDTQDLIPETWIRV
ncbi:MAG: alpha-1,2-fucosyltransferase [bacterium]|nr:alpha-1,2-fucosyltransferase [bacterium]